MKLGPKFDDDIMPANCDVIVTFLSDDQFGAIRKPDSGPMACKTSLKVPFYLKNTENWTKKSLTQLSYY